jgi:hypothetical protein
MCICKKQENHIFCKQKEEMTGRDQKLLQNKKKEQNNMAKGKGSEGP